MPFFKIITDKDWDDDGMLKLVKESCKIFSEKGYFHKDLSKRHVAKYTENDKIKIVFIDLSRVENISVDRSEEMYSCIINDTHKQPTVASVKKSNLRPSSTIEFIQKTTDATTKTNTKKEQSTPSKAPKGHQ
ncbi:hypothetical protein ACTFIY_007539 [Dictyostelium cf. discoideum]